MADTLTCIQFEVLNATGAPAHEEITKPCCVNLVMIIAAQKTYKVAQFLHLRCPKSLNLQH